MHKMEYNKYLLILLLLLTTATLGSATATGNITAIYAFGDSIFDAGNNKLPTICRADHLPYGTNMPIKRGRFSNGELPTDILVADFGYKTILPAYLSLYQPDIQPSVVDEYATGVTFASACSGFDDVTALEVGVHTMTRQFEYFVEAYDSMERDQGLKETMRVVEAALFLVSGGANDMLENYYPLPLRKFQYSLSAYHNFLLSNLETFVKKLYTKGAKRIGVLGMPPLGCLPMDISSFYLNNTNNNNNNNNSSSTSSSTTRECVSRHNSDARQYNAKLQVLIKRLNIEMPQCKFAYVDVYNPMMDMISNPNKFGLEITHEGCCGTGSIELGPLCSEYAQVCPNPSKYLFWDAAHPTLAAYRILTKIFKEKTLSNLLS